MSVFTDADSLDADSLPQSSISSLSYERKRKKLGFFKKFLNIFKRKGRKRSYEDQNDDWDSPNTTPNNYGLDTHDMPYSPHGELSSGKSGSSVPELVDDHVLYDSDTGALEVGTVCLSYW